MKQRLFRLILIMALSFALAAPAYADSYQGREGMSVTFTSDGKMKSNLDAAGFYDDVAGLQPGDDITFTIDLSNQNRESVDWYMINKVIRSLEDGSAAAGGAYTYDLRYKGPAGEKVLYSSDAVGGELAKESKAATGLHQASNAMEDYFYLDRMSTGQKGVLTLKVALDGETQGNAYVRTLADLQMRFAVELKSDNKVVRTGDETNLTPWYIGMGVSGALLLLLAIDSLRPRKKRRRKAGGRA